MKLLRISKLQSVREIKEYEGSIKVTSIMVLFRKSMAGREQNSWERMQTCQYFECFKEKCINTDI